MAAPTFLANFLKDNQYPGRPYVTLTFAQSLDAKIAGKAGKQLILSGKESMKMTHWMRTMHDAILVGIGTALNDDPQLNTRHLPPRDPEPATDHGKPYHLPRPIVLDSQLRLSPGCKLLKNFRSGNGRRPWVVCAATDAAEHGDRASRRQVLEDAGARVLSVPSIDGFISIPGLLDAIYNRGIRSLMVEGGATVIKSFFDQLTPHPETRLVDSVIVTVAPLFVGNDGVGYGVEMEKASSLRYTETVHLGDDTIIMFKA
ncbi:hypothetical protein HGRIS_008328 [Hohenbuehelia grisea]|uniref:2,5-diamino-6-ribosylamino-4(3H)-pyrimidinone 5'-phosphate reductase n=1 Tax=Hohenbuehelia grisea TaxID=104357 RepID=A0ABR3J7M1_9AGAR